jgi:HEAT repeat protein
MAIKRSRIKGDPFRLNEPAARVPGGSRRTSIVIKDAALAAIRGRERLSEILLQHDPNGPALKFTARDMGLLRQIAREGTLTNHVPAIRRSAILLLASSPVPENVELLTELAVSGEDFYVRSHALLALGNTGLKQAAPVLALALRAEGREEKQAAEAALRVLARHAGPTVVAALRERERDEATRGALERVLRALSKPKTETRRQHQTMAHPGSRRTAPKPR